ncbi:MAG: translation initiation factor IF-3 [SAR324 cluster bacterium]|uniref:Translation initiation factor IF-3 n=1 Tax=SAR324 cluster bacterium TaxID=2024889 RepID=A0A2A4T6Y3_9DELT|nr:MAG: translation initiation factor IF-3 [SAR324 cluster bacterium]
MSTLGEKIAVRKRRKPEAIVDKTRINRAIRAIEVRVVDEDGEQLGVLKLQEALEVAQEKGLDLVEVSDKSRPPVCRIMDYGKFKYQKRKKQNDAKKRQTVVRVKEIKLRPKTEEHDFQFKLKNARGFLTDGNKVKVTVQYRGREMAYTYLGIELLDRFTKETEDLSIVEVKPRAEGRIAQMILAPKKTS